MKRLKLSSVDEANKIIDQSYIDYSMATEELALVDCRGRVLAEEIIAQINVPDYRRSTVDGYAVILDDLTLASIDSPTPLNYIGKTEMGHLTDLVVTKGETAYVPTGGMVPNGANAVMMQEFTEKRDGKIFMERPISNLENVIEVGGDIKKDSVVLQIGTRIRTQEIGAMAAIGKKRVKVFMKPRVSILCTGDELISIEDELKPGKIRDMNTITLKMIAEEMGCIVVRNELVVDDFGKIQNAVERAVSDSDLLVVSGGSSVGEKDVTADVFRAVEKDSVLLHGIRVKPGKPTIIARIQGKPVFGLPGHPVSALNIFRIFVNRALDRIQKQPNTVPRIVRAKCSKPFNTSTDRDTYQMVKLIEHQGSHSFEMVTGKSGMITLMTKADGYIFVSQEKNGVSLGEDYDVIVFN